MKFYVEQIFNSIGIRGLLGGTVKCERLPSVKQFIKKRLEPEGDSNR
ncbi:hypothetical protein [Thalassotalea marina]|nr:hypothetical protein [Thalassotalea marina]